MADPNYSGDGRPDGEIMGRASGKLSFFGVTTTVTRQVVAATTTTTGTTTALQTDVDAIRAGLTALGLFTSA